MHFDFILGDGITGNGKGEYWKSTDWGRTFAMKLQISGSEIPGMACSRLKNSMVYGTNWGSGGVQRSINYGDSWPNVSNQGSAWGVDIAGDDLNVVMFGTYGTGETFLSLDGGTTFTSMDDRWA